MEKSASFSGNEVESKSLDFSKLREKGLEYIQELSGDVWTDYNSHDPGVTILEQICYSITDIALRTSLPIEDLLTTDQKYIPFDFAKNAFFTPQNILSSFPVTIADTRKMIIDHFEEIQNVWITIQKNNGYEEALKGLNQIEILPKIDFANTFVSNPEKKKIFLERVNTFMVQNRNLGEWYDQVILLEPQDIDIYFRININDNADLELTIAKLLLQLLEYIYTPINYTSFEEMQETGFSMEGTFSGPKLSRGFLKDNLHKHRLKKIHTDELQKILTKVDSIKKCEVSGFHINDKKPVEIAVEKDKFFHVLQSDQSTKIIGTRFDRIYKNMTILVHEKELSTHLLNKQRINSLFSEVWMKKHKNFPIESSMIGNLKKSKQGSFRKPKEYHSLQRHFPLIYGIGEEGLSKNESEERHIQALQLKGFLILFEQHLANHLAQLGNLNEFFNINSEQGLDKTYFSQRLDSVPLIEKLGNDIQKGMEINLESRTIFYSRKNRIYNHLLARFGEEMNETPWKVAFRLNLIPDEHEFQRVLIRHKSNYLQNLENLSYFRTRAEFFLEEKTEDEDLNFRRIPSGLEEIICCKTGIPVRNDLFLVPEFIDLNEAVSSNNESHFIQKLEESTRDLGQEISSDIKYLFEKTSFLNVPRMMFKDIDLKTLFKETLNHKNYRIFRNESSNNEVQILFQNGKNNWINLHTSQNEKEAIHKISQIMSFFIDQNRKSEGFYIVDHILLRDLLTGSKFGFKFLDFDEEIDEQADTSHKTIRREHTNTDDFILFQSIEEDSWSESEEERNEKINQFYRYGKASCSYVQEGENWLIKGANDKVIATSKPSIHNRKLNDDGFVYLHQKTRSMIQLFNGSEKTNGRLRFKEVEKKRAKGNKDFQNNSNGQRRLVFQRKLSNGEIIDEDFFNLMVTILLPDWPTRFQEERFRDFVSNLINERIPSHIGNELVWVDHLSMKNFEEKYAVWQRLRLQLLKLETSTGEVWNTAEEARKLTEEVRKAALDVYHLLVALKKN